MLAIESQVPKVLSVESDAEWLENLKASVNDIASTTTFIPHHADIGPTGEWGLPKGYSRWKNWPDYSRSVRRHPEFEQPDLILVDGRFRVSCFLTSLACCETPARLLFDDYGDREQYKICQDILPVSRMVGRMAVFDIVPGLISARELVSRVDYYHDEF